MATTAVPLLRQPNRLDSPTADPDHDLMQQVAAGEQSAFEALVIRHERHAWAVAWRILGDAAEAEDVVQEAFLRVLRAAARYRPDAPFQAYFLQVVTRLCLDYRAKRRPEYPGDLPEIADQTDTPEERLQHRERALAVRCAFERLPARYRAALALRHEADLSYMEIAQVLGVSRKAAGSLLQRARQSLQGLLKGVL